MTTLDDLVAAVEASPTNPIIAAMLTDELLDARDMTRTEADTAVSRVQRDALPAHQIRLATELLYDGTASRRYLLSLCYASCRVPRRMRPTVFVTSGHTMRVTPPSPDVQGAAYWGRAVILAGADLLLSLWESRQQALRARARLRYRLRRSS